VRQRLAILLAGLSILAGQLGTSGQSAIRKQATESSALVPMSAAELAELGDPMFTLVLRDHPQEIRLDEIERLIMGATGQRHLFVVDEQLQNSAQGGTRRAVLAYKGTNQSVRLDPNIALSALFNDQGFDAGFLEVWGWDDGRSRYNYYKLEGNPPTWRFRGSSVGADQLNAAQRRGTCMACHTNGGPLMKELPIPWNNWHSFRNTVSYLSSTSQNHWRIAETLRFRDLRGAEGLETGFILPSIRQFNGRRLSTMIRPITPNEHEVTDGPRTLRSLFLTTEYNITSAGQLSGVHPLAKVGGSAEAIAVPDAFFLNANLLAGGGLTQYEGLGVPEARQFSGVLQLQPKEYQAVVTRFSTSIGGLSGDANFAWFVPEPSHVDNQFVDLLIRRGVVTRDFAAAVLAVDLENPVFSKVRGSLLALIPPSFRFKPLNPGDVPAAHPDQVTRDVIAKLESLKPSAGSPEAEFLALLESPNPVEGLRMKVNAYQDRVRMRLGDALQSQAEVDRLYRALLRRRQEAVAHNPALVESSFLFPVGKP